MKHIKLIALILSILALLSSCSSESGKRTPAKPAKKKVRVHRWNHEKNYQFANVELIYVDTAYRPGDTILIDAANEYSRKYYIIQP